MTEKDSPGWPPVDVDRAVHRLALDPGRRHPILRPALAIDVLVFVVYVPVGDTELVKIRARRP